MKGKVVKIDSQYLRDVITASGKSIIQFSMSCGLSRSAVSNLMGRGECLEATARLIALTLGIDYERLTKTQKQDDYLKADDKAIEAMVNALCAIDSRMRTIERKVDRLMKELGCENGT